MYGCIIKCTDVFQKKLSLKVKYKLNIYSVAVVILYKTW